MQTLHSVTYYHYIGGNYLDVNASMHSARTVIQLTYTHMTSALTITTATATTAAILGLLVVVSAATAAARVTIHHAHVSAADAAINEQCNYDLLYDARTCQLLHCTRC
eukprot:20155-Heterococcus_DN1.PRE.2